MTEEKLTEEETRYYNPVYSKEIMNLMNSSFVELGYCNKHFKYYDEKCSQCEAGKKGNWRFRFFNRIPFLRRRMKKASEPRKARGVWDLLPKTCWQCKISPCLCQHFEKTLKDPSLCWECQLEPCICKYFEEKG